MNFEGSSSLTSFPIAIFLILNEVTPLITRLDLLVTAIAMTLGYRLDVGD